MSRFLRFMLALVVLLAGLGVGLATASQSVAVLPRPALDAFEPAAAAHLEEARQEFDAVRVGHAAPEILAEKYGELAMVYYGYELHELAAIAWRNALELVPDDGRWLYLLGLLTRIEGEWGEAQDLLGRAVAADPDNHAARVHWGRVLLEMGDVGGAERQFLDLRESLPTSAAATLGLARTALGAGRYEEAILWGRRTLALEPQADVAHHHIGLAFRGLGDVDSARRHLGASGTRDVSIPDPLTDGLADLVRGAAIQAKHGVEAARTGRHQLAIRYFSRAVEIAPDQPGHRYNLAVSLREDGQPARAVAELRWLVERFPAHRDGHFNLAGLLAQSGDTAGAAHHYRRAVEIDPTDRVARIEWAGAISHLGEVERAQTELRALIAADEDDAESRLGLATLLLQQGRRNEAAAALSAGLERDVADKEWAALADFRGQLAAEAGDMAAAKADFESALARQPDLAAARLRLGRLLARNGNYADAAEQFRQLVDVEPAVVDYQLSLAIALQLAGASDELVAVLDEATLSVPQSVELRHMLAKTLVACRAATASTDQDAARAVRLAQRVMDEEPTVDHAATVAAALAAGKDFDGAVSWQERVVEEWDRLGDTARSEESRRHLAAYRAGEACPAEEGDA